MQAPVVVAATAMVHRSIKDFNVTFLPILVEAVDPWANPFSRLVAPGVLQVTAPSVMAWLMVVSTNLYSGAVDAHPPVNIVCLFNDDLGVVITFRFLLDLLEDLRLDDMSNVSSSVTCFLTCHVLAGFSLPSELVGAATRLCGSVAPSGPRE